MTKVKNYRRDRIRKRIRKIISGSSEYPRMSVFRSNKEIYCQVIDDNEKIDAVAFNLAEEFASINERLDQVDLVSELQINDWNGRNNVHAEVNGNQHNLWSWCDNQITFYIKHGVLQRQRLELSTN